MNKITAWITPGNIIKAGDEITTTTSEFNFDCLTGSFDKEATIPVEIIAEHIAEDYSEYVQGKHNNGGCYGYDYWKVIKVINSKLYAVPCNHRPLKNHFEWRNTYYIFNRHKTIFSSINHENGIKGHPHENIIILDEVVE